MVKKFRGFEGEVEMLNGMGIINAQGNYDQGRGADGLGFVKFNYAASRYGADVPESGRPARISGKPLPPPTLDPQYLLPRVPTVSTDLVDPGKVPTVKAKVIRAPTVRREVRVPMKRRRRPNKARLIRDRQRFVNWLKTFAPQLYVDAKKAADVAEANGGTLGELAGWFDTFTEKVSELGGKYLQFRTQKEILEAQLERMKQGLPPLETGQIAPTIAVKPDPGTTREITGAIGAGFGRMLPFLAVGLALFLFMRR